MGRVVNIYWVTDKIGVSGRQPKSAMMDMQRAGIRSVLNLSQRDDPKWPFVTLNDGLPDDGMHKPTSWFGRGIHFVLQQQHSGKVLIHCESGVHRGPSMAYAVLRAQGMSHEEATARMLRSVPHCVLRYAADAEQALQELGYVNHDG